MAPTELTPIVQHYMEVLPSAGIHPTMAVLLCGQSANAQAEWSDIELIIVAPEFDGEPHFTVLDRLWESLMHADHRIQPIACGVEEWKRGTARPIIDMARREGVVILPRAAAA